MKLAEALALVNGQTPRESPTWRVALVCGFSPLHLQTFLAAYLIRRIRGRFVAVETGIYGDLPGNLERFAGKRVDAAVAVIEWADLDPRLGYRSAHGWREGREDDVLKTALARLDQIRSGILRLSQEVSVSVALPTLALPPVFDPPSHWASTTALALRRAVAELGESLSGEPAVRVLDPQQIDRSSPPERRLSLASEFRAGFPYSLHHASAMACELSKLALPGTPKKGIITDLDNTLWRGILGEDGVDGISWDLDHDSQGHALYQAMLASLSRLGVLLGVASKNDAAAVERALERENLIVPPDLLFPIEANWGPKSRSVQHILNRWNVHADAVVFVDDSEFELAEVRDAFPEIETLLFPSQTDAIDGFLRRLRQRFGKASITEEDRLRGGSLRAAGERERHAAKTNPDELLARAEAKIKLHFDAPDQRSYELVNKTNQFNLNGRRVDEATWRSRVQDPARFLIAASYADKYGPLGKITVVSGRRGQNELRVDTWVMSCRAFSRRIEYEMLKAMFDRYRVDRILLDYVPTDRNGPLGEFLGVVATEDVGGMAVVARNAFAAGCPFLFSEVSES
ncbi:MAG TPA: HAD-IIIC family phosphatase [Thermoguttaceae bacterium]|nr:HAD-IIIC family phosphatase [Thermoguttaceae bacterium]